MAHNYCNVTILRKVSRSKSISPKPVIPSNSEVSRSQHEPRSTRSSDRESVIMSSTVIMRYIPTPQPISHCWNRAYLRISNLLGREGSWETSPTCLACVLAAGCLCCELTKHAVEPRNWNARVSFLVFYPPHLSSPSLCKPREKRTQGGPTPFPPHRHLSQSGQIWGAEETHRNRKARVPLTLCRYECQARRQPGLAHPRATSSPKAPSIKEAPPGGSFQHCIPLTPLKRG